MDNLPNRKIKCALIGTDWNSNETRKKMNHYGGVTYYRLIKPLLENVNDDFEFTYYGSDLSAEADGKTGEQFWNKLVSKHDIFITKCIDNEQAVSNLIFFCRKLKKKIILDLDDNIFEVKPDQPAYEVYAKGKPKRAIVAAFISMVDALFVSTQPLADYYAKYIKNLYGQDMKIFVLPNYNDISEFHFPIPEKEKDKIIIGWTGSITHFNDLKIVLPALERLMKEFPNLYIELSGGLYHKDAIKLFANFDDKVLDRIHCGSGTESWFGYPELLSTYKWNIGIAPLTSDEFNRGKSHIKWMEYSTYAVPTIASRVYPYHMPILGQNTIVDGKTGFLCDEKEWYYKLKKLILHPEIAEKIGQNARDYVINELQYKQHHRLWINALSQIAKS